jgi:hypothetical protein
VCSLLPLAITSRARSGSWQQMTTGSDLAAQVVLRRGLPFTRELGALKAASLLDGRLGRPVFDTLRIGQRCCLHIEAAVELRVRAADEPSKIAIAVDFLDHGAKTSPNDAPVGHIGCGVTS